MGLAVTLLVVALVLFALGFVLKWLFIIGLIVLVIALISFFSGRRAAV